MGAPLIPGYTVNNQIGSGGMACVYLAHQHNFDREVALKILSTNLVEDEDFCERFLGEARIVAKLRHNHIVPVYDVGNSDKHHYIAMEYIVGGDLKSRIQQGRKESDAVRILTQIASALNYAHNKGIVHRDIKPDNILFRKDGTAVLTDFGIAKDHESILNLTRAGTVAGTPSYMSPEQILSEDAGPTSDIYSLGVLFFKMLTGELPYKGNSFASLSYKHIHEPIPQLPSNLKYQPLINKLLAKKPEDRYQSAGEIINDLNNLPTVMIDEEHGDRTVFHDKSKVNTPSSDEHTQTSPPVALTPKYKLKLPALTVLGIAVVAGIAISYTLMPDDTDGPSVNTAIKPAVIKPAVINEQTVKQNSLQQNELNKKIISLLSQAKSDLSQQRLMKPKGNNAYEKYQKILQLAPNNPDAQNGVNKVALAYISLSEKYIQKKNIEQAGKHLQQAISIAPNLLAITPTLNKLSHLKIEQAQQASNITSLMDQLRISGLLRSAELDEKEGRINGLNNNNAINKYQQILSIDPDHKTATKKLAQLQN